MDSASFQIGPLFKFTGAVEVEQEAKSHKYQNGPLNEWATFWLSEFLLYIRISAKFVNHIPEDSKSRQITNDRWCNTDADEKEPEEEVPPRKALVAFRSHVK